LLADKVATDRFRLANLSPAELSRESDPISEARKLTASPRASVSRSNEVRIPPALVVRSVAGGAMGSGEHAERKSDETTKTPMRVKECERMVPLAVTGADEG
jgi:hypothetical protein